MQMSAPPAVLGRRSAPTAWLIGPAADTGFVLGGGLLLSLLIFAAWRAQTGFLVVATLFVLLSDLPHVGQTSVRVLLDREERQRYGRRYTVSLLVIGTAVGTLIGVGALSLLLLAWTYWQILHVLKQHYGVMNIYAVKAGYRGDRHLLKRLLFAGCLAPVLFRASFGLHFGDYWVLGKHLYFSRLSVPTPPIPMAVVAVAYAGFAVLAVVFAAEQVRIRRQGGAPLPVMGLATLAIAVVSYNIAYLLVSDLYALILIATATHSLQYHVINYARNRGRYGDASPREGLLSRLSQRRALPAYVGALLLLGAVLGQFETVALGVLPLTLVFHHFYMDGYMWRPRDNPNLARWLNMRPPARVESAA